jgi:hypothetical protein
VLVPVGTRKYGRFSKQERILFTGTITFLNDTHHLTSYIIPGPKYKLQYKGAATYLEMPEVGVV